MTRGEQQTTHNCSRTRLYIIWKGMRQRCTNPKASGYKNYGGRGIAVCSEWDDFSSFKEWATANGYKDPLCIDRVDNNKDYCPDNCRWVTKGFNTAKRNKEITGLGRTLKSKYSAEDVAEMSTLREKGATYKVIANKFGLSISHVSRLLKGQFKYLKGEGR